MKCKITAMIFVIMLALTLVSCSPPASDSSDGGYSSKISEYETTIKALTEETTKETTVGQTSKAESKTESLTSSSDDEYILPHSDTKKLTDSDLSELSEKQLELARNEIYARHGRKFKTDYLQEYFNSKSCPHKAPAFLRKLTRLTKNLLKKSCPFLFSV